LTVSLNNIQKVPRIVTRHDGKIHDWKSS